LINLRTSYTNFRIKRQDTIRQLKSIRKELEEIVMNCKISNTVGNSVGIIGAIMTFTPLFVVGIPLAMAGAATSFGTAIAQSTLEHFRGKDFQKVVEDDERLRLELLTSLDAVSNAMRVNQLNSGVRTVIGITSITTQAVRLGELLADLSKAIPNAGVRGAINAAKGFEAIIGIGIILSVGDIIATWTLNPPSLKEMDKIIDLLQKDLEEIAKLQIDAIVEEAVILL
jgi:hypothetical protein